MHFKIRTARIADIPALHRIRGSVQENRLSDPQCVTETSYLPYINECSAWVAETDVGVAGFSVIDVPAKNVWALFVDPHSEGAGIGRALHHRMLEWAREQGIDQLSLSTSRGTRAERFYKGAGWIEVGPGSDGEVRFEKMLT